MVEINYVAIFLGIAFVLIGTRLLFKLVHELALFSAVFGIITLWHYWGTMFLNLPLLPMEILQFAAAGALFWGVLKIVFIFSLFPTPLQPIARQISILVNGN